MVIVLDLQYLSDAFWQTTGSKMTTSNILGSGGAGSRQPGSLKPDQKKKEKSQVQIYLDGGSVWGQPRDPCPGQTDKVQQFLGGGPAHGQIRGWSQNSFSLELVHQHCGLLYLCNLEHSGMWAHVSNINKHYTVNRACRNFFSLEVTVVQAFPQSNFHHGQHNVAADGANALGWLLQTVLQGFHQAAGLFRTPGC